MDDLAQISPWRSRPRREEPTLPLRSPLVFGLAPAAQAERRPAPVAHAHRLGITPAARRFRIGQLA